MRFLLEIFFSFRKKFQTSSLCVCVCVNTQVHVWSEDSSVGQCFPSVHRFQGFNSMWSGLWGKDLNHWAIPPVPFICFLSSCFLIQAEGWLLPCGTLQGGVYTNLFGVFCCLYLKLHSPSIETLKNTEKAFWPVVPLGQWLSTCGSQFLSQTSASKYDYDSC